MIAARWDTAVALTAPRQPRERAVACFLCGFTFTARGGAEPRTETWNASGLCDKHEAQR